MPHRVAHLVYPGFELLDASGPASVFAQANYALRQVGRRPFYEVMAISPDGGAVPSSSGVALDTRALSRVPPARVDTLLVDQHSPS